jgi:hypothetical protein
LENAQGKKKKTPEMLAIEFLPVNPLEGAVDG